MAQEIPMCRSCSFPMKLRQRKNPGAWDGGTANGKKVPFHMVWVCQTCGVDGYEEIIEAE